MVYGVIAFGLAVGLCTLVYLLAHSSSLTGTGKIVAMLILALAVRPLFLAVLKSRLRGGPRATLGVALLVFALLVGAGEIIVAVVGRGPWIGSAAVLLAIAVALAAAAALVLRLPSRTRVTADTMRWHEGAGRIHGEQHAGECWWSLGALRAARRLRPGDGVNRLAG